MSYPKPRKKTVIGVQNVRRLTPDGKEVKDQIPVVLYGKLPNTMLPCKESGCKELRLSGTARCKNHVRNYQ